MRHAKFIYQKYQSPFNLTSFSFGKLGCLSRAQFFDGAHDLVVEVISPSSIRLDRVTKFTKYEQTGVQEYWLVDPQARIVEAYVLSQGEYGLLGTFKDEDVIQSQVLAGIAIVAKSLFA